MKKLRRILKRMLFSGKFNKLQRNDLRCIIDFISIKKDLLKLDEEVEIAYYIHDNGKRISALYRDLLLF